MFPFLKSKTQEAKIFAVSRRQFLRVTSISTTGLILGVHFAFGNNLKNQHQESLKTVFKPNAYLKIDLDGTVIIVAHRSEMGQGIRTSLPMVVAEELDADWSRVKIIQAEGNEAKYGNQNTDGSFSVRMFYKPLRQAGATAKALLIQAAANQWGVLLAQCRAENHQVINTTNGNTLDYGALAEAASQLPMPDVESLVLKNPKDFKFIGTLLPIVDNKDIVTGKAIYGMDAVMNGMKIAVIARCPVVGGKVKSFDAASAKAISGVLDVIELTSGLLPPQINVPLGGVSVVAENTWAAIKGRDALNVEWDFGPNSNFDSAKQLNEMTSSLSKKGNARMERGNVDSNLSSASHTIDYSFEAPFYAHGTIEPPAAVASVVDGKCEVLACTQHPEGAKEAVAKALKIKPENVTVNVTLLGGGFGRKSKPDFIVEAAMLSQKTGMPIKVIWTREDDIHHDFYHAQSAQNIRVGLDAQGKVTAWNHKTCFSSIVATSVVEALEPADFELGLGAVDIPYDFKNLRIETLPAKAHARIGWIRSVSNIHHSFAIGSMIDEIALARKKDAADNIIELLGNDRDLDHEGIKWDIKPYNEKKEDYPMSTGRMKNVIKLAREKSNWGKSLSGKRAQGIAFHHSFLTYVACVVEVAIDDSGTITIPEVHYAVDCGVIVNRDRVISQFEGGAAFATSLALNSAITFKNGRVAQNNFDGYQIARMPDAPKKVFVHLVESDVKPTGVGEPPVPAFIPALANALSRASGKRITKMPMMVS
ncbi:xanthine dehydrogenase family protein molybdopterin-binding subunit [Aquimarina sp. U1-2]|uniref:xanthine dehydrogenase family protein molybdopterin-binding subunit n=1 Tax=Aquimarina sp. U1-2 TaxID=2823141 RepID=UPI001AEC82C7|nr:molybdopterin cofactor-binding domain-containing protein [Aquimarina sp. U1-2]MBP2831060.1 xanthine dehydrogenase family protein molybdopterin-binding subunit [Aquimarina sp. U1-2]